MIGYVRLVEKRESGIALERELSAVYYNACHYTAVTAQKLCCGVDNKVCAPLYRSAKIGCCEGAVYYKRDAVLVGYLADLLNIRYVCIGVADKLGEEQPCLVGYGIFPGGKVIGVNELYRDAHSL